MRLPSGNLDRIASLFLEGRQFAVVGCLSSEDRCRAVPERLVKFNCQSRELLEIVDPPNAFPDYREETKERVEQNRQKLQGDGVDFDSPITDLLATEDQLLDLYDSCKGLKSSTLLLDITSLPKRFFCFFLKRVLDAASPDNVVVTYTLPTEYTQEHLAEDPMTCDHLPGFAAPLPPSGDTLVISIGFEPLSLRSILEVYRDPKKGLKLILPFPPDGDCTRREYNTLRQITSGTPPGTVGHGLEVIASWDSEEVYRTLARWNENANGLTLAPFGPKPHSLGMALFAMKHDCGLYYTQPKSYNPDYSKGCGSSWAYVVKWDGVPCFDRPAKAP